MLTPQAWPLSSELAGVGAAMIVSGHVPASMPAHTGVSQSG